MDIPDAGAKSGLLKRQDGGGLRPPSVQNTSSDQEKIGGARAWLFEPIRTVGTVTIASSQTTRWYWRLHWR